MVVILSHGFSVKALQNENRQVLKKASQLFAKQVSGDSIKTMVDYTRQESGESIQSKFDDGVARQESGESLQSNDDKQQNDATTDIEESMQSTSLSNKGKIMKMI